MGLRKLGKFKTRYGSNTKYDTHNFKACNSLTKFPITNSQITHEIEDLHNDRSNSDVFKFITPSEKIESNKIKKNTDGIELPRISTIHPSIEYQIAYSEKYPCDEKEKKSLVHKMFFYVLFENHRTDISYEFSTDCHTFCTRGCDSSSHLDF